MCSRKPSDPRPSCLIKLESLISPNLSQTHTHTVCHSYCGQPNNSLGLSQKKKRPKYLWWWEEVMTSLSFKKCVVYHDQTSKQNFPASKGTTGRKVFKQPQGNHLIKVCLFISCKSSAHMTKCTYLHASMLWTGLKKRICASYICHFLWLYEFLSAGFKHHSKMVVI